MEKTVSFDLRIDVKDGIIILKQYDEHLGEDMEVFVSPYQVDAVCDLLKEAKQKLSPHTPQIFGNNVMFTKSDTGSPRQTEFPSFYDLQVVAGVETVTLTEELIRAGMTGGIGINKPQQEVLGITSLEKGWLQKLIGKVIPKEDYDKFVSLKGATSNLH